MPERWYVLRSKPRKEVPLARHARSAGHEVFLPLIPAKRVNPRASRVSPYFPGYLFVRANLSLVGDAAFRWMPLSQGLVQVGGEPAAVAEHLIKAIHERVKRIWAEGGVGTQSLKPGDRVLVQGGVFEAYEGIFDVSLSGGERARILLRLLSDRLLPVELDAGLLGRSCLQPSY